VRAAVQPVGGDERHEHAERHAHERDHAEDASMARMGCELARVPVHVHGRERRQDEGGDGEF
jgi:hypothetical protein